MSLLHGFTLKHRDVLTPDDEALILNNIAALSSMARSLNDLLCLEPVGNQASNLAFTAALLNEMIELLADQLFNGLNRQ